MVTDTPDAEVQSSGDLETTIAEIRDDRIAAGTAISAQAKTISLGVLAVTWILLGGTQPLLSDKFAVYTIPLVLIAFLCILALLFDFMQYLISLIETDLALKSSLKAKVATDAGYDENSLLRRVSTSFFVLKIVTTLVAALWLMTVILIGLIA